MACQHLKSQAWVYYLIFYRIQNDKEKVNKYSFLNINIAAYSVSDDSVPALNDLRGLCLSARFILYKSIEHMKTESSCLELFLVLSSSFSLHDGINKVI